MTPHDLSRTPIKSRRELFRSLAVGSVALLAGPALLRNDRALAQLSTATATGKTPAYAATLQQVLMQLLDEMLVPGAAVIVQSPELGDWAAAFGTRTLNGTQPVTLHDHVRIGSNTKTMTGTIILQLVDEGTLNLDDPISAYRPDVPNGDNITIAQLLRMRSGLYNYSDSLEMNQEVDEHPARIWTPDEVLAIAFAHPPLFDPGANYSYSNTNYVLLGLVIEQLTGDSVENQFYQRIFAPLEMGETVMPALTSNAIALPHPQGYQYGTNVETRDSPVLSAEQRAEAAAGALLPIDVTDESPSWAWTAGSAISTAGDLARYAQALVGGGLLSSDMQALRLDSMRSTDASDPTATRFGLGLAQFGPLVGFIGNIPGFNSLSGYDPLREITVVTWTSLPFAPDGRSPATELATAIVNHLYGPG